MVVHTAAQIVEYVSVPTLIAGTVGAAGMWSVKAWAGGRKCTWEREWAGKMIMVVGPPTTTVLSLISTLLRLPSPPQILYLPPLPSPLPQDLLTILHTLRLSTNNPQAQLHCEPLPPTPRGIKDFVRKWTTSTQGTVGEAGRRVDAIILAEGWEVMSPKKWGKMRFEGQGQGQGVSPTETEGEAISQSQDGQSTNGDDMKKTIDPDPPWTTHQSHLHLLTSLLPHLLRTPERDIRLISLISPGYAAALPSLQSLNSTMVPSSPLIQSGIRGLTSLLMMARFGLILDTLASAMPIPGEKPVPAVRPSGTRTPGGSSGARVAGDGGEVEREGEGEEEEAVVEKEKKKEVNAKSNIMAISVIMPWCRGDVLRGIWGADESWLRWILYMLFFPLLLILTPSPSKSTQSILYALSAPVRHGPIKGPAPIQLSQPAQPLQTGDVDKKEDTEVIDPRRSGVGGGDVVRDCAVVELPPVLCDPLVARAHYDKIEKEVEEGVRQSQIREKASGKTKPEQARGKA